MKLPFTARAAAAACAITIACTAETHGTFAPAPETPTTTLRVTIQEQPDAIVAGTSGIVSVAVARDGVGAYLGPVNITLVSDDVDGIRAIPTTLDELSTTTKLVVSVAANHKHGDVIVHAHAVAADVTTTMGDATIPLLIRGIPGELDSSFASNGQLVLNGATSEATSVVATPEGTLLLGGRIENDVAIVRLSPDGSMDATFGIGGVVRIPIATLLTTTSLGLIGDSILFGGSAGDPPRAFIVRISKTGALDSTFGDGGIYRASSQARSTSLTIAENGTIYIGGQAASQLNGSHVFRLLDSGLSDPAWGGDNGVLFADDASTCALGNGNCFASALIRKADDRITFCESRGDGVVFHEAQHGISDPLYELSVGSDVLASCTSLFNNTPLDFWAGGKMNANDFAIRHFTVSPSGGPLMVDPYWPVIVLPSELAAIIGPSTCASVARQGYIVVVADVLPPHGHSSFAVVHLSAVGSLDTDFGAGKSYVTTAFDGTDAHSRAIAIQPDHRMVVVGTNGKMIAARYWQ